ncbi:MAG: SUMF1/EgtB/PvdO family nonheme iron enzyme, partial [Myxococcales bacterium]|nr:SUMF1/EgtB/PvdO family nonheme iron enzyme [Myxococcales bacterium]
MSCIVAVPTARAAEDRRIEDMLSRPGTKLLAVSFGASWCAACRADVPAWKKLHARRRADGLRVVVVCVEDEKDRCRYLQEAGWRPDDVIHDPDGSLARRFGVSTDLPAELLWTWQGNLVRRATSAREVSDAVDEQVRSLPRLMLGGNESLGKSRLAVEKALATQLTIFGKLAWEARDPKLRRQLDALLTKGAGRENAEGLQCELGARVPANSLLLAELVREGRTTWLYLSQYDAERGCGVASVSAPWDPNRVQATVAEAFAKLISMLRGPLERPGARGGRSRETEAPPPDAPPAGPWKPQIESGPLRAAVGELVVRVRADAPVRLELTDPDGKEVAVASPYRNAQAQPGRWRVRATARGYAPGESEAQVLVDEVAAVNLALEKLGELAITGRPEGAEVQVSGPGGLENRGGLPWRGSGLIAGTYRVVVSRRGYAEERFDVVVPAGGRGSREVGLKRGGSPGGGTGDGVSSAGGSFMMGSPAGDPDESPAHMVELESFWLTRTEVTVDAYAACEKAGKCSDERQSDDSAYCNAGRSDRGDHPMNCVSWEAASAYCKWVGGRLPTEAEWEYAARGRGGSPRQYPWGDTPEPTCSRAVMSEGGYLEPADWGCGESRTWPVCSKPSGNTPEGVCDLAGNVWEWVGDWYDKEYYQKSPQKNPAGPQSGSLRVRRGGSRFSGAGFLPSAYRHARAPSFPSDSLGVRCL